MAQTGGSPDSSNNAEDAEASMREMMGFSAFGGTSSAKRRKTQDQNATTSSDTINPLPSNVPVQPHMSFLPASLPPRPAKSSTSTSDTKTASRITTDGLSYNNVGPYPQAGFQSPSKHTVPAGHESLPPRPPPSDNMTSASPAQTSIQANYVYSSNDIRSDPSYWDASMSRTRENDNNSLLSSYSNNNGSHRQNQRGGYGNPRNQQAADPNDKKPAYTNIHTGISFTRSELAEYARGKKRVEPDGSSVTVYFQPEFVREGLWDRWEVGREQCHQGKTGGTE